VTLTSTSSHPISKDMSFASLPHSQLGVQISPSWWTSSIGWSSYRLKARDPWKWELMNDFFFRPSAWPAVVHSKRSRHTDQCCEAPPPIAAVAVTLSTWVRTTETCEHKDVAGTNISIVLVHAPRNDERMYLKITYATTTTVAGCNHIVPTWVNRPTLLFLMGLSLDAGKVRTVA